MQTLSSRLILRHLGFPSDVPYADRVLALNPVGYWKLDESGGATASDSSGNGLDGTYSNVTLADTDFPGGGLAPTFNGTTSKVTIPHNALLMPANTITFGLWLNMAALNGNFQCLMMKNTNGNWDDGYGMYFAPSGSQRGFVNDYNLFAGGIPTLGNWQSLICTYDGNELIAYENGVAYGLTRVIAAPIDATLGDILIGTEFAETFDCPAGNIAHVFIFDYTLTPGEVASIGTI